MAGVDKVVSPAEMAAAARHASCYEFLASIGGAAPFLERLRKHPFWLDDDLRWLLSKPSLLDMTTKQAWLHYCIENKMKGTQTLVTDRNNLVRACAELHVDETTGELKDDPEASRLNVVFQGEAAAGDGLRREWFRLLSAEVLNPDCGLF